MTNSDLEWHRRCLSGLVGIVLAICVYVSFGIVSTVPVTPIKAPQIYSPNLTNRAAVISGIRGSPEEEHIDRVENETCIFKVLLWRQSNTKESRQCPGLRCQLEYTIQTDQSLIGSQDVVVFFHRSAVDWHDMVRRRPPGQKWVFYTMESPRHTVGHAYPPADIMSVKNPYDYLMTFRLQAHFHGFYGHLDRTRPLVGPDDATNWAANKTKTIAWMASNCGYASWKRMDFVRTLQKFMPVDTYGGCGTKTMPRNRNGWIMEGLLPYRFYLALENSECDGYITEKFWKNALYHSAIPVVYGPPREDYAKVVPSSAFIHVKDFSSVKQLSDYMKKVMANETLYNSYFEWKKLGRVVIDGEDWALSADNMCNVAERVLKDREMERKENYDPPWMPEDWKEWWFGSCRESKSIPIPAGG